MKFAHAVAVASASELPPVPNCSFGLPSLMKKTWLFVVPGGHLIAHRLLDGRREIGVVADTAGP